MQIRKSIHLSVYIGWSFRLEYIALAAFTRLSAFFFPIALRTRSTAMTQDSVPIQVWHAPSAKMRLPDMLSVLPLQPYLNRHHKRVVAECAQWFIRGTDMPEHRQDAFMRHRAPFLSARCYPTISYPHLRANSDALIWFFNIDDISDMLTEKATRYVAADCMAMFRDPHGYAPVTRTARMGSEYVRLLSDHK